MSNMEYNKGKLIPFNLTEDVAKALVDAKGSELATYYDSYLEQVEDDYSWYDEDLAQIGGKWYKVVWEVKYDTNTYEFAEACKNKDGSIDFHTYHHNGGAYWTEVVERALEEKNNEY